MPSTIIQFILILITHALAGIYSSTLKYDKKTTYVIWGVWICLQGLLLTYSELFIDNEIILFLIGFVLSFVGQYLIFFYTTKGRLGQRIFTMLTYSIFFTIFMGLFSMVQGSLIIKYEIIYTIIHAVMLLGLLIYFLQFVCPLCRSAAKNITKGWGLLIFVNIIFLITVILSSVFPVKLTNFTDPSCIVYIFLSISIMVVYSVIFININSLSEAAIKREIERQNKLLLAQIEAEKVLLAKDSQARHDRRHHNLILLEFANKNDVESIKEYLSNLVKSENEVLGNLRYCDNMIVNTVLTVYDRRAKDNDLKVKINAQVSKDLNVSPQDLVIIIANLFENAINGALKVKNKSLEINILIKETSRRLLINIENTCKEKLNFDESLYGIGIRSIIDTINKYDGMYDFSIEDGLFVSKISLNLK